MAKESSTTLSPPVISTGNVQAGQTGVSAQSPIAPIPIASGTADIPPASCSLTSKEWVIPPRPKPGRKPATDAPPTKRKAQNRAAQRAFRERRAARVGELEEEIKKMEMEDEEEQNSLRAQIEKLQQEVEEYRASLNTWMQRCRDLEAELAVERAAKEKAHLPTNESLPSSAFFPISQKERSQDEALQTANSGMGCGNCSSISDCQCIQDVINMEGLGLDPDVADASSHKRPRSPAHNYPESKRIKPENVNDLETDFTTSYSNHPSNKNTKERISPSPSSAITDPCGFCSDGTPCICAEMQAAEAIETDITNEAHTRSCTTDSTHTYLKAGLELDQPQSRSSLLYGFPHLSRITPPPSDTDVSLSTSSNNPCVNGPGNCLQCRTDPNSTLFCKSLAKSREQQQQQQQQQQSNSTSAYQQEIACCGGNSRANDSCCQSTNSQSGPDAPDASLSAENTRSPYEITNGVPPLHSPGNKGNADAAAPKENPHRRPIITLSCADAYTTLSRHPGYPKAAGEMARWLPRLQPTPNLSTAQTTTKSKNGVADNRRCRSCMSGMGQGQEGEHGQGEEQGISEADYARVGSNVAQCRPAMEIDAANVMAVLRDFDRRFNP